MPRPIQILIVEDDKDWGNALRQMYEEILSHANREARVELVTDPNQIEPLLQRKAYDLISVDIGLESSSPENLSGMNGIDVIELAAIREACVGIVVITQFDAAELLAFTPRNAKNERISLRAYLNQIFSWKNDMFQKTSTKKEDIPEAIEILKGVLTAEKILSLGEKEDPNFWSIIKRTLSKTLPLTWLANFDKVDQEIIEMIKKIILVYETDDQEASSDAKRFFDELGQRNDYQILQWRNFTSQILRKVMSVLIGVIVAIYISHKFPVNPPAGLSIAAGGILGFILEYVVEGFFWTVFHCRLILEVGIRSISYFGRNYRD